MFTTTAINTCKKKLWNLVKWR